MPSARPTRTPPPPGPPGPRGWAPPGAPPAAPAAAGRHGARGAGRRLRRLLGRMAAQRGHGHQRAAPQLHGAGVAGHPQPPHARVPASAGARAAGGTALIPLDPSPSPASSPPALPPLPPPPVVAPPAPPEGGP